LAATDGTVWGPDVDYENRKSAKGSGLLDEEEASVLRSGRVARSKLTREAGQICHESTIACLSLGTLPASVLTSLTPTSAVNRELLGVRSGLPSQVVICRAGARGANSE